MGATGRNGQYCPHWEGEIVGYARNFVRRNLWRCLPDFDEEDLMQEAYLFYLICEQRYKVNTPAHFMALFKTCLFNRITALATRRSRDRSNVIAVANCAGDSDLAAIAGACCGGLDLTELHLLLADAPDPIVELVARLAGSDERPPRMQRRPGGRRETTDEWLARIAGAAAGTDMRAMVRDFLAGRQIRRRRAAAAV